MAEHPRYGRVIVTTPEPDLGGRVAFVRHADYHNSGHVSDWCDPAALTYIDGPATPEAPAPAPVRVGDEIASADDPRIEQLPVGSILADCGDYTVEKSDEGCWKGYGFLPHPIDGDKFGPWTVERIGQGADQ